MKIVIVGLGSMGKRRLKILKNKFNQNNLFGFDLRKERRKNVEDKYGIKTLDNLHQIFNEVKPDIVFLDLVITVPSTSIYQWLIPVDPLSSVD